MKLAVFSAKPYDKLFLTTERAAEVDGGAGIEIIYHDASLSAGTAALAEGAQAVCVFVNDTLDAAVLEALAGRGVKAVMLRCAGYNNVDLAAAARLGLLVANVPSYSPEAVAEFALALVQTLNRNTHRAYNRVREGNFSLDGLLGRTLHGKTVGVVGTGKIGVAFARIAHGFGCRVVGFDPYKNDAFRQYGEYIELEPLLAQSDVISLHCPLTPTTRHIMDEKTLAQIKQGALLVNTSRGGLIDTRAVIAALKSRRLGGLALDVYEGEGALFYNDHSGHIIDDDELMRLTTFHNVLVCGHQAFFTEEALREIAECTIRNLADFANGRDCANALVKPAAAEEALTRTNSIPVRT